VCTVYKEFLKALHTKFFYSKCCFDKFIVYMFLYTCHIILFCVINLDSVFIFRWKYCTCTFSFNFDVSGLSHVTLDALHDYICEQILEECSHYGGL
jgi:hypothetical protein